MKKELVGVIFMVLFLRANCVNDKNDLAEMKAKMDAMQKRLSKMDAMEKRQETKEKRLSKMNTMEERLETLERQASRGRESFFSVQLLRDVQVLHGGTVPFDSIIVNYGNDYFVSGGIYIAPADGYYMFTLVVREDDYSHAAGSVTRTPAADLSNTVTLCRAEQGEHAWQTGSCTVIKELSEGDQVYVVADGYLANVESSYYMADGYTSFTGLQVRSGLE